MKTTCLVLAAAAATVSADSLRGAPVNGTNYWIKSGALDSKHCEELWIPKTELKKFWAEDGWRYPTYTDSLCDDDTYHTVDDMKPDADDRAVIHVKRGMGADSSPTISLTPCSGNGFTWTAGTPVKGSDVTVTGTGTLSSTIVAGFYNIDANFGIVNLVNVKTEPLGQDTSEKITVLGNNFGTMNANSFSVPASGDVTFSISLPVPNIDGTVTGQVSGVTSTGDVIFCTKMTMDL